MEEALAHLRADPAMSDMIDIVGPYRLKTRRNRYWSLIESIVSQQLSGAAADSVLSRLRAMYPGRTPRPQDVASTPDEQLRLAGLSRMKVSYVKDISERVADGRMRMRRFAGMTDEQVIEELVEIRGIGVWTAQMFLIFSLGRLDVLPLGDLGIRRGFEIVYGITAESEMKRHAEMWRPFRTVASWYLWKGQSDFAGIG